MSERVQCCLALCTCRVPWTQGPAWHERGRGAERPDYQTGLLRTLDEFGSTEENGMCSSSESENHRKESDSRVWKFFLTLG